MAFFAYQIAAGYNNAAGFVNIEAITPSGDEPFDAPDGLGKYRLSTRRAIRGDGTILHRGFPSTTWTFAIITYAQMRYLMETYCGGGYSGFVTISTHIDDDAATYDTFNAVMTLPDLPEVNILDPIYENYVVTFTRMVAL